MRKKKYRVRLESGRELGPIDLDRIERLISKNQIRGEEWCLEVEDDSKRIPEWRPIRQYSEVAEILLRKLAGKLDAPRLGEPSESSEVNVEVDDTQFQGSTVILGQPLPGIASGSPGAPIGEVSLEPSQSVPADEPPEDPTVLTRVRESDDDRTQVTAQVTHGFKGKDRTEATEAWGEVAINERNVSQDKTVLFSKETAFFSRGDFDERQDTALIRNPIQRWTKHPRFRFFLLLVFFGILAYELAEENAAPPVKAPVMFRPSFPQPDTAKADPAKAKRFFDLGLRAYVDDTMEGYQNAAKYFLASTNFDFTNIRALGLLASSYIHLVDSTSQDAEYFSVITKILEIARVKGPNIPEVVIADSEFYQLLGKYDSAIQRINEYTKTYPNYGREMFYYVAEAAYHKGDARLAAKMLTEIPDKSAFSPKVYYLRGLIAEALSDTQSSVDEFQRALKLKPKHAKSLLKIAEIFSDQGKLSGAAPGLEVVVKNPQLLQPKLLAKAYFLHARWMMLKERWRAASEDLEKATQLDRNNRDYMIEYYSALGRESGLTSQAKKRAQMFLLLGAGEKKLSEGSLDEAMALFLKAREVDRSATLPLLRLGETFLKTNNLDDAKNNFRKAFELDPKQVEVASKYGRALIETYDWTEAQRLIERLASLRGGRSPADKLSGDLFAKQGLYTDALIHYRRAMTRDTIDPDLYNAYARTLVASKNPDNASLFFGLARRFDPLNMESIVGTAEAMAQTESSEIAIRYLQGELAKVGGSKPELLTAIADLYLQKGDFREGLRNVQQVLQSDPTFAKAYWVLGQLNLQAGGRFGPQKAIQAFRQYSERNPSDASGYLERYKIFLQIKKYDQAELELDRIASRYPKFPNLFLFRGDLFTLWGNRVRAIQEYENELKNHPTSAVAMISLGKAFMEAQRYEDALKRFSDSMRLAPRASEPRYYAGYVQYLLKNYQGAVALLLSASQIDPGNPLIYKRLGDAYVATGNTERARDAYKRYLELAPDAPDKQEVERFL